MDKLLDVKNIILKDLGGVAQYRRCAHVIEICIGFLAATGNNKYLFYN